MVFNIKSKLRFFNINFDVENFNFWSSTIKVRSYCNRKFTVLEIGFWFHLNVDLSILHLSGIRIRFQESNQNWNAKNRSEETSILQNYDWCSIYLQEGSGFQANCGLIRGAHYLKALSCKAKRPTFVDNSKIFSCN